MYPKKKKGKERKNVLGRKMFPTEGRKCYNKKGKSGFHWLRPAIGRPDKANFHCGLLEGGARRHVAPRRPISCSGVLLGPWKRVPPLWPPPNPPPTPRCLPNKMKLPFHKLISSIFMETWMKEKRETNPRTWFAIVADGVAVSAASSADALPTTGCRRGGGRGGDGCAI